MSLRPIPWASYQCNSTHLMFPLGSLIWALPLSFLHCPDPKVFSKEPLAKVLPFMVRYLTTNGESAVYNPTPPFVLRYRRAGREFCKRFKIRQIADAGPDRDDVDFFDLANDYKFYSSSVLSDNLIQILQHGHGFLSLLPLADFSLRGALTRSSPASATSQLQFFVYARHGRELMGCKSPVHESGQ